MATKTTTPKSQSRPLKSSIEDLLKKYRSHKGDTGSTEVQIIQLSERITELASHLQKNPKDFDSKRGLLMLVAKRRRLLNYLQKHDLTSYEKLVVELGLRK